MRRLLLLIPAFLVTQLPVRAQMNPYQIGMEFCGMVNNGVSRKKAWNYVISSYVNSSPFGVNRGDPYAPWSPTRTLGGAIGSGLASGIAAGMQLRSMKGDIEAVIDSNCPEGVQWNPSEQTGSQGPMNNPNDPRYCDWNPWLPSCKDSLSKPLQIQASNCDKTIKKYDCSYVKYLDANPSIEKWAKANPAMAKKEAVRLGAIDAENLSTSAQSLPAEIPATSKQQTALEEKCMKAADYKGCMEYNKKK